ncbi:MAG TPA: ABC transporter permease [Segeticoccus sp.]|nr:ABC transporter permease [Segeticoccus sp.]
MTTQLRSRSQRRPSAPATAGNRPRRRAARIDRPPRAAVAFTALFFTVLYLPIVVVVLFSFNSAKSLAVFHGFSTRWYHAFFRDAELTGSVVTSIEIAAVAMVGSVVLGVLLGVGLVRSRARIGKLSNVIMLVPLITPEIITGVASLLLFKAVDLRPSLVTVMLAETTFSISYVTVILRSRIAEVNPEVEDAAMDLGASRWQAFRTTTLPLLWPTIVATALLVFTMVFDDFVLAFFTTGVTPQPISVRIYSAIRFGIQPTINAVGTLMLGGSILLIVLALVLTRLLGRRGTGRDLFGG